MLKLIYAEWTREDGQVSYAIHAKKYDLNETLLANEHCDVELDIDLPFYPRGVEFVPEMT